MRRLPGVTLAFLTFDVCVLSQDWEVAEDGNSIVLKNGFKPDQTDMIRDLRHHVTPDASSDQRNVMGRATTWQVIKARAKDEKTYPVKRMAGFRNTLLIEARNGIAATKIWSQYQTFFDEKLLKLTEPVHIRAYEGNSTSPGFYFWHQDAYEDSPDPQRKRMLTMVAQLSDPDEYKGGDFMVGKTTAEKSRGALIIFPSYVQQSVLPVTDGVRYEMVAYFSHSERDNSLPSVTTAREQHFKSMRRFLDSQVANSTDDGAKLEARLRLGDLHFLHGDLEEGLANYENALQLDPKHPIAKFAVENIRRISAADEDKDGESMPSEEL